MEELGQASTRVLPGCLRQIVNFRGRCTHLDELKQCRHASRAAIAEDPSGRCQTSFQNQLEDKEGRVKEHKKRQDGRHEIQRECIFFKRKWTNSMLTYT